MGQQMVTRPARGTAVKQKKEINVLFKALFRINGALGTKKKLPVLAQVQLAQATILNAALYPSAVLDTDYNDIDKFMARVLNRITGCHMRWTSKTFLRGELGLPPSKYMAHRRALNYLWHVERKAWFGNYLPFLRGPGPYRRLLNIAKLYGIDASLAREMPQQKWKSMVKTTVMEEAARDVSAKLAKMDLPATEPRLQCRPYVRFGGHNAMYGVQYRWRMMRHRHPTLGTTREAQKAIQKLRFFLLLNGGLLTDGYHLLAHIPPSRVLYMVTTWVFPIG